MPEDELEDSTPDRFDQWYSDDHGGTGEDFCDFDSMDSSGE